MDENCGLKFHLSYRISSYSFCGNYSFLNLEIRWSQYIRPKVTVHKCAETIQGRKLYEEIRYVNMPQEFLEIPPCAHHVILITEFVLLIKTPHFYEVNSFNRD